MSGEECGVIIPDVGRLCPDADVHPEQISQLQEINVLSNSATFGVDIYLQRTTVAL